MGEKDDELGTRDQNIKDLEKDVTLQNRKMNELMTENNHLRT